MVQIADLDASANPRRRAATRLVGDLRFQRQHREQAVEPLRLVLFADAGQAFGYKEDFDLGKLRYSVGTELRVFLPVFQFPLRFIYAWNPDPQPGDRFSAFKFSIGNTF
jgi:outer membrane protein assembly factor BamA